VTKRENEVMKYIRRSIEENGILHPIEIKKNSRVKPGMVRDNILQLPAWYI